MTSKTISVATSDTDATVWYDLPGASGEINREALEIDDSILGQEFQSQEVGLISWVITGSALYKGFAGYVAKLRQYNEDPTGAGAPVAFTKEAMTREGTTRWYAITLKTKNVWDRNTVPRVYLGTATTAITEDMIEEIDYLFGRVKFKASYTAGLATGAVIKVSGKSLMNSVLGRGMSFTLNMSADAVENTTFEIAQGNGGFRTYQLGLKTVGIDVTGIYKAPGTGVKNFVKILQDRKTSIVEINPDGLDKSSARGFFKLITQAQSGDVGALEEETINYSLNVPSSEYLPFSWAHTSDTTLHQSARICLDAFIKGTPIYTKYLFDGERAPGGAKGWKGQAIVTEVSLEGGLDVMNEFSVTLQGTGAHTDIP